jgi:hypothetical protein
MVIGIFSALDADSEGIEGENIIRGRTTRWNEALKR